VSRNAPAGYRYERGDVTEAHTRTWSEASGAQEGARRPWWRRVFGG
jgi:hypothetical protein